MMAGGETKGGAEYLNATSTEELEALGIATGTPVRLARRLAPGGRETWRGVTRVVCTACQRSTKQLNL